MNPIAWPEALKFGNGERKLAAATLLPLGSFGHLVRAAVPSCTFLFQWLRSRGFFFGTRYFSICFRGITIGKAGGVGRVFAPGACSYSVKSDLLS